MINQVTLNSMVQASGAAGGDEPPHDNSRDLVYPSRPLNLLQNQYIAATVLILGDSFIRRISDYANRCYGPYNNLEFD